MPHKRTETPAGQGQVRRQRRRQATIEIAAGAWVEVPAPTPDEIAALARFLARRIVEQDREVPHDDE